jgi:hypothetical protein
LKQEEEEKAEEETLEEFISRNGTETLLDEQTFLQLEHVQLHHYFHNIEQQYLRETKKLSCISSLLSLVSPMKMTNEMIKQLQEQVTSRKLLLVASAGSNHENYNNNNLTNADQQILSVANSAAVALQRYSEVFADYWKVSIVVNHKGNNEEENNNNIVIPEPSEKELDQVLYDLGILRNRVLDLRRDILNLLKAA